MPDKTMMILERVMDVTAFRRKILASNIANADTPGYKAKDVSFQAEMRKALDDIKSGNIRNDHSFEIFETTNTMPNRDGNTVNVDIEMAKISENSLTYNTAIQLYSRKARMLRDAIKAR
ncbi:MAG: flagellar basal body rod protein FlgB [Thermodesulfovibrionales bacterium]